MVTPVMYTSADRGRYSRACPPYSGPPYQDRRFQVSAHEARVSTMSDRDADSETTQGRKRIAVAVSYFPPTFDILHYLASLLFREPSTYADHNARSVAVAASARSAAVAILEVEAHVPIASPQVTNHAFSYGYVASPCVRSLRWPRLLQCLVSGIFHGGAPRPRA